MAKRRAEDTLLHDSPSKRHFRPLCSVDMQLGSMAPIGGVSPPSLLALLGSRSRKRPYYFEESDKQRQQQQRQQDSSLYRKAVHCDARKHAANVGTEPTSGSFQDLRSSSGASTSSKKRPREDCAGSETVIPKAKDKLSTNVCHSEESGSDLAQATEDTNADDCTYNSFQYWRAPLPELDLSLLEDNSNHSLKEDKSKVKDLCADAMET